MRGIKLNGSLEKVKKKKKLFPLLQVVYTIFPRQIKNPWPFFLFLLRLLVFIS